MVTHAELSSDKYYPPVISCLVILGSLLLVTTKSSPDCCAFEYLCVLKMRSIVALFLLLSIFINCASSARILVLYIAPARNHKSAVMPIIEELAQRGHQMTVVSPFTPTREMGNVHEIVLDELTALAKEMTEIDWFAMQKAGPSQLFEMLNFLSGIVSTGYDVLMRNEEFRTILRERSVDLIIFDALFNDYVVKFCHHLKIPCVVHSSAAGFPSLKAMGAPMDYASVPALSTNFNDKMTFFQRMANMAASEIFFLVFRCVLLSNIKVKVERDFPNSPSIEDLQSEISLAIVNSNPATAYQRSLPPTILAIGALHTRPAKPLPKVNKDTDPVLFWHLIHQKIKEFRKFADDAKEGFIVFTLGSTIKVSTMPKETLDAFLNAFAKLPQRIFWKWEAEEQPLNIPPNVMMSSWLPQQDLLGCPLDILIKMNSYIIYSNSFEENVILTGHENARIFITHGGMMGFQESIYHAIPLLCLPLGNDQSTQASKAQRDGFGIKMDWNELNENTIYDAIQSLLHNPR